jgi:K+-transporting ATPase ATPase B chain
MSTAVSAAASTGSPAPASTASATRQRSLFDPAIVRGAAFDALRKLDPRRMIRNPVMFVVEVGSAFTTILFLAALSRGGGHGASHPAFIAAVSLWLWFTVLFANFAEAMAEGRGKAQAESLRKARKDVMARRLRQPFAELRHVLEGGGRGTSPPAGIEEVLSSQLRVGEHVLVTAGELIPADGEIEEGVASVDESAITGESAPVIRESGGDRSAVTGGTRVLSDWLVVRVASNPGETFLDRIDRKSVV